MAKKQDRCIYFEIIRVLAIALVIFNHTRGYMLFQNASGVKQIIYMCLTMITRINVPLFFMISGALLLSKEETIGTVLKKRILRFFLVIVFFQAALYGCNALSAFAQGKENEFTLIGFVRGIIVRDLKGTGSYWYLYAYLGMLFVLPFMQRIAKGMQKHDGIVLLVLHAIFYTAVPGINLLLVHRGTDPITVTSDFAIPFVTIKAFFYPVLGYWAERYIDVSKYKKKHLCGLFVVAIVSIVMSCVYTYCDANNTGGFSQNYVQTFDYILAIVIYLLVKYFVQHHETLFSNTIIRKSICGLGSLTLGMYLLDPFFKLFVYNGYEPWAEVYLPTLLVSFGWVLISMTLGGVVTWLLRYIPGMKKII